MMKKVHNAEGVQLIEAVYNRDHGKLRHLLLQGVGYINKQVDGSGYYEPALHVAIRQDDEKSFVLLLGCSQLDLSAKNDPSVFEGVNPLTLCVFLDRPFMFKQLLKAGASVHGVDKDGAPTIMYAASKDRVDFAKELIGRGADVNAKNNDRETSLYFAKMHHYQEMQELLLKHGAVDDEDEDAEKDDILAVGGKRKRSDVEEFASGVRDRMRRDENAACGFYDDDSSGDEEE